MMVALELALVPLGMRLAATVDLELALVGGGAAVETPRSCRRRLCAGVAHGLCSTSFTLLSAAEHAPSGALAAKQTAMEPNAAMEEIARGGPSESTSAGLRVRTTLIWQMAVN